MLFPLIDIIILNTCVTKLFKVSQCHLRGKVTYFLRRKVSGYDISVSHTIYLRHFLRFFFVFARLLEEGNEKL